MASKKTPATELVSSETAIQPFFQRALANVREEVSDNPYIREALKVLPVGRIFLEG